MTSALLATMIFLGISLNAGACAASWSRAADGFAATLDHFRASASVWPTGAGAGRPATPSAAGAAQSVKLASAAQQLYAFQRGSPGHGGKQVLNAQARMPRDVKTHAIGNDRGLSRDGKNRENILLSSINLGNAIFDRDYDQAIASLGKMAFWRGEGSAANAYGSKSEWVFKAGAFSDLPSRLARVNAQLARVNANSARFSLANRPDAPNCHPTVAPGPQAGTGVAGLATVGALGGWRWRRRKRVCAAAP